MNICFVGIGSIARRHIRNIREICAENGTELHIDALRRKTSEIKDESQLGLDNIFFDTKDLAKYYDAIFITNPTDYHIDILEELHDYSDCFFIEKPLTSLKKIGQAQNFICKKDKVYYVACPLRYSSVIDYLKSNINVEAVRSARCISSSYLPDWRPGIDYRTTYSANKDLGGGVSVDLIHEWDYIKYLFGMPQKVMYMNGQISKLELDCEDYAIYLAEYVDKIVELHLDYFGRKTIREIMIMTDDDTIIGDLVNSRVTYLKEGRILDFGEKRDDFQKKELRHFLDIMSGRCINTNTIKDAYQTLQLTQGEIG